MKQGQWNKDQSKEKLNVCLFLTAEEKTRLLQNAYKRDMPMNRYLMFLVERDEEAGR